MDNVLFAVGPLVVYKSACMIALGVLLCALCTLLLYWIRTKRKAPVLMLLFPAYILSLFFARLLHWYFTASAYSGFRQAMTDPYAGGFALSGVIIGCWLSAWLLKITGLIRNKNILLDCLAPGLCLLVLFIRLSNGFTGTMLGNKNITAPSLQWEPLVRKLTDPAGNVYYRLQVWLIEAVMMVILFAVCLVCFHRFRNRKMLKPCTKAGNVARIFLIFFALSEVVTDSLRNDSVLMRFRFLHQLTPYSSFISLAQIFALVLLLAVFVYFLRCSILIDGFGRGHALSIALFLLCLVLMGATGEFCIQRYGMKQFLLSVRTWGYLSMIAGCIGIALIILKQYSNCRRS